MNHLNALSRIISTLIYEFIYLVFGEGEEGDISGQGRVMIINCAVIKARVFDKVKYVVKEK